MSREDCKFAPGRAVETIQNQNNQKKDQKKPLRKYQPYLKPLGSKLRALVILNQFDRLNYIHLEFRCEGVGSICPELIRSIFPKCQLDWSNIFVTSTGRKFVEGFIAISKVKEKYIRGLQERTRGRLYGENGISITFHLKHSSFFVKAIENFISTQEYRHKAKYAKEEFYSIARELLINPDVNMPKEQKRPRGEDGTSETTNGQERQTKRLKNSIVLNHFNYASYIYVKVECDGTNVLDETIMGKVFQSPILRCDWLGFILIDKSDKSCKNLVIFNKTERGLLNQLIQLTQGHVTLTNDLSIKFQIVKTDCLYYFVNSGNYGQIEQRFFNKLGQHLKKKEGEDNLQFVFESLSPTPEPDVKVVKKDQSGTASSPIVIDDDDDDVSNKSLQKDHNDNDDDEEVNLVIDAEAIKDEDKEAEESKVSNSGQPVEEEKSEFIPVNYRNLQQALELLQRLMAQSNNHAERIVTVVIHPIFSKSNLTMANVRQALSSTFGCIGDDCVFIYSKQALPDPNQSRAFIVGPCDLHRDDLARRASQNGILYGHMTMSCIQTSLKRGELLMYGSLFEEALWV